MEDFAVANCWIYIPAAHEGWVVRSGYIRLNYSAGTARNAGLYGYGWPRYVVAFSNTTSATAYRLYFNATWVVPSSGPGDRWYGFSLRCLSTALEG